MPPQSRKGAQWDGMQRIGSTRVDSPLEIGAWSKSLSMAAFQGRDSDQAGSQDGPSQHLQPFWGVAHSD